MSSYVVKLPVVRLSVALLAARAPRRPSGFGSGMSPVLDHRTPLRDGVTPQHTGRLTKVARQQSALDRKRLVGEHAFAKDAAARSASFVAATHSVDALRGGSFFSSRTMSQEPREVPIGAGVLTTG